MSLLAVAVIAHPMRAAAIVSHAVVFVSLLALVFPVLRAPGLAIALGGTWSGLSKLCTLEKIGACMLAKVFRLGIILV